MTTSVEIKIQFDGKFLTLPVNPEDIQISRSAENTDIDIIGTGKATRKGDPSLKTLTISSFFPGSKSYFYSGVLPKTCIDFIDTIWNTENKNNTVGKITTTGLPTNVNMYFVIESFDYDHKAGEEDDIYYDLKIKEYKPYGVRKVQITLKSTTSKSRTSSTAKKNSKSSTSSRIYIVKKGDCLWSISKACSGNGNNWKKLYNLNKKVIGKNPNLIYPGQKLTLPAGWKNPTSTTKSKTVKKTASTKTSSKKTSSKKTVSKSKSTKKSTSKPFWETSKTTSKAKNRTTGTTAVGFWKDYSGSKAKSRPLPKGIITSGGSGGGGGR